MTPTQRSILALIAVLIIFPLAGFICEQEVVGKIAGTVYVDGRPMSYATVQAWKDDELVLQERTTQYGHYTLPGLLPGTYKLVVLNAMGAPIGRDTIVEMQTGRFYQVDIELNVQTEGIPD